MNGPEYHNSLKEQIFNLIRINQMFSILSLILTYSRCGLSTILRKQYVM